MSTSPFSRFTGNKLSGAKKKEFFKQEKRKAKKETRDYFDKLKESKRTGAPPPPKGKRYAAPPAKAAYDPAPVKAKEEKASYPAKTKEGKVPYQAKTYSAKTKEEKAPYPAKTKEGKVPYQAKTYSAKTKEEKAPYPAKPYSSKTYPAKPVKSGSQTAVKKAGAKPPVVNEAEMPLNKFIAHCGVCSRRDAAGLVTQGKITVNDVVVTTPGYKVQSTDVVKMGKQTLTVKLTPIYILLNKPKDCLTTLDDPHGRDTVLRYIRNATSERVYPVGRLDRNTTGVLILTNDGELANKLTHPSFEVRKIYEVKLDRPLEKGHYDKIMNGITLEDGFIAPDALAYADAKDKSIIGIEIHSGRNRIVRRIFEYFGYDIKTLDRVSFANLTKKNVERGKWRFLMEREVRNLKFMNTTAMKKKKAN